MWKAFDGIAGDLSHGFYGEVLSSEFITGDASASAVGLTAGISQNSDEPWLKFALDGKTLYVAKKAFRYDISWISLDRANIVSGSRIITIKGKRYKVRLLKGRGSGTSTTLAPSDFHGSEWNLLMLPILEKAGTGNWTFPDNVEPNLPNWNIGYSDGDLLSFRPTYGIASWCSETVGQLQLFRGAEPRYNSGDFSDGNTLTRTTRGHKLGWRPCLELEEE
ncbi:MAG: hypothetical protein GXZ11_01280 [Tissierellia bacterium]|nr:hypothetical protein [Tissierellia bacterium]